MTMTSHGQHQWQWHLMHLNLPWWSHESAHELLLHSTTFCLWWTLWFLIGTLMWPDWTLRPSWGRPRQSAHSPHERQGMPQGKTQIGKKAGKFILSASKGLSRWMIMSSFIQSMSGETADECVGLWILEWLCILMAMYGLKSQSVRVYRLLACIYRRTGDSLRNSLPSTFFNDISAPFSVAPKYLYSYGCVWWLQDLHTCKLHMIMASYLLPILRCVLSDPCMLGLE